MTDLIDAVTLKEYLLGMIAQRDKAVEAALASQEKAVNAALAASTLATDKAERDALRWRESANEWRATMNDREVKFVNVDVFSESVAGLRQEMKTKAFGAMVSYFSGALGIIAAVVAVTLTLAR